MIFTSHEFEENYFFLLEEKFLSKILYCIFNDDLIYAMHTNFDIFMLNNHVMTKKNHYKIKKINISTNHKYGNLFKAM
jgi:hypothetical protein